MQRTKGTCLTFYYNFPNSVLQNVLQDQPDKAALPVLSDFSEGLIGKLQIRKSGKVQLVMGNVTLDVSEGAAFSFLQVS